MSLDYSKGVKGMGMNPPGLDPCVCGQRSLGGFLKLNTLFLFPKKTGIALPE